MSLVFAGAPVSSPSTFNVILTASILLPTVGHASHIPVAVLEDNFPKNSSDADIWIYMGVAIALVLLGGIFAGLTIALMGQDEIYLRVLAASGDGDEKKNAAVVLRLLEKGKHWVLVTLLLSNVITNETLPIVLDRSLGGGLSAVAGSTVLIVIFGEILPQSVCVRYGLPIGAWMSPVILALMWAMCPVAWPAAKLLDFLLGKGHATMYKKAGLKTLVTLHETLGASPEDRLNQDEVTIINAVLDLKEKPVGSLSIMTPMDDVFTMSSDTVLDERMVNIIFSAGYSRIPIHQPGNSCDFVGMLLVKLLITYDPEDGKQVRDFALATLPETRPETSCLDIINYFQEGKSHMVLVSDFPGEPLGALGVVTLEDVIEELIGEEITDESDIRRIGDFGNSLFEKATNICSGDLKFKEHVKLGPSNAASHPRPTQIRSVKVKPSISTLFDIAGKTNAEQAGIPIMQKSSRRINTGVTDSPASGTSVARSGSLSECVFDVNGIKKVVLDIASSSDSVDYKQRGGSSHSWDFEHRNRGSLVRHSHDSEVRGAGSTRLG